MHVIEGCCSASEKVESLRKEEAVGEFSYFSGFCLPQCQQLAGTKEQAGYCWSAHSRCLDGHMVLHVRGKPQPCLFILYQPLNMSL